MGSGSTLGQRFLELNGIHSSPAGQRMGAGAGKEEAPSWARALSSTTLGDILSSLPKKTILKLDENESLSSALRFLAEHRILSAPVTRGGESDIGFLDMLDIVGHLRTVSAPFSLVVGCILC